MKKVSDTETTIFVYDASNRLVAEYSTLVEQNPQTSYLTTDNLGSVRIITTQLGQVIKKMDFRPFGEELTRANSGQSNIKDKFATYKRDDETGLDFAQARMFGSNYGRFTSPDPTLLSVNANNPQSWNRYIYVMNNPLNLIDPLGLWAITWKPIYKQKDGKDVLDENGQRIVTGYNVTAIKTKGDKDTPEELARQLGLKGNAAKEFAKNLGSGDNIRLSETKGGGGGDLYKTIEKGLTDQSEWERKNFKKLDKLHAKGVWGPSHSDCSRTACQIGLGIFIGLRVGTNILDPLLDTEADAVASGDEQSGNIIRYAKDNNVATHFANFIFSEDDGTPVAFSKSGEKGRYEIRSASSLETELYGKVRGRNAGDSGYYKRR